jgi:branched-chain amino acid transport system substrate-binding protein
MATLVNPRAALVALLVAFPLTSPAQKAPDNVILIGQSAPYSGVLGTINKEGTDGALVYFDWINARGGVHGRKVVLEAMDDQQDAKKTAENTRILIEEKGVIALFMYRTSPSVQAALPMATAAKVPIVASQVAPNFLYEPVNPYVFNIRARYQDEVIAVIEHLATTGITRIAFLQADDAYGKDVAAGVAEGMKRVNNTLVATATFDNKTTDVIPASETIAEANPDAVIIAAGNKPAAAFIKQMRQAGSGAQFFTLSNTSAQSFIKELGEFGHGVVVAQVMPYPYGLSNRIAREFQAALKEHPRVAPSYASLGGFVSGKVIVEGLKRAGPQPTREKLVKALETMQKFDLGDFIIDFSPQNRHGSKYVELTVIGRNGNFIK